ncbi:MAG TPA: flagellar biosynthetic protein FliO [Ramlibacter sp.]|nr:flagellar biosynthetic protein FliO [Ramlibacter sp.]
MRSALRLLGLALGVALYAAGPAHVSAQALAPASAASAVATSAAPAASLPASLPLRRDAADTASADVPWFTGLLLLGPLAAAGVALVRYQGGSILPRRIRAGATARPELTRVASQSLTAQASVHVIRWGGEELLVGCTPAQVSLLSRRPLDATPDDRGADAHHKAPS